MMKKERSAKTSQRTRDKAERNNYPIVSALYLSSSLDILVVIHGHLVILVVIHGHFLAVRMKRVSIPYFHVTFALYFFYFVLFCFGLLYFAFN